MERLRVNRFDNIVNVLYFIIEHRLGIVYGVVEETDTELSYYDICMAPFWDDFQNQQVYQMVANPTGERFETGLPCVIQKHILMDGIFAHKLDITQSREEALFVLTGKRTKAVKFNVIG